MTLTRRAVVTVLTLFATAHPWAQAGAPGTPTNVRVDVPAGNATLTVSWTVPTGAPAPAAHQLRFYQEPANSPVASLVVGPAAAFTVAIPPGTQGNFSVTVTAIAGGIPSPPSMPFLFTIAGGPSGCTGPPSAPARLRFSRVRTVLDMRWDPVAGATEYIIEAGTVSDGTDIFVGSVGLATQFAAMIPENLHAFVRVRARNACGTSLRFDEIEIGAMWSLRFRPGLDVAPCGLLAPGGFCSQVLIQRTFGAFDEIWSPMTPVLRVVGTMTPAQVTATLQCTSTSASGTLQAAWDGERYVGTVTLGGQSTNVRITPGNFDPQCEQP